MEANGHFLEMLLLSLMAVSASYAWYSDRICPDQRFGIGDDCSRNSRYCPLGSVCEQSGQKYTCRLPAGSDCSGYRESCSTGAVCEQSGQQYTCRLPAGGDCSGYRESCSTGAVCEQSGQQYTCKLPVGGDCGTDDTLCVEELVCDDQSGQCKIDTGDACSDDDECMTGSFCFSDKCACGGRFNESEGVLTSPNYPNDYPTNQRCVWIITAPEGYVVKLTFTDFVVEYSETPDGSLKYNDCEYDYLQLRDGPEADAPSLKLICGEGDPATEYSPSNVLQLVFVSDDDSVFSGFSSNYTFVLPGP